MRVIIDRFEEDKAVIETDGGTLTVPRALFGDAHEGDHVEITVLGKPHKTDEGDCCNVPESSSDPLADSAVEASSESPDRPADIPDNPEADDPSAEADPHSIFERLRAKRKRKS